MIFPTTAEEMDKGLQLQDKDTRIISGSFAENAQWVAEQMANFIRTSKVKTFKTKSR